MFRSRPTFRTTLAVVALLGAFAAPAARAVVGPTGADFPRSTGAQAAHPLSMDVVRELEEVQQGRVTKQEFMRFMEEQFDRMTEQRAAPLTAQTWADRHR